MTTREDLFKRFVPMAGRITDLRAILQNPGVEITSEDAKIWAAQVRQTVGDLMDLLDDTKNYLTSQLPREPSND